MLSFLSKFFPSKNERVVRKLTGRVAEINRLEQTLQAGTADVLRQKTQEWKERLSGIEENQELKSELAAILPEAFAVVKNACRRLYGSNIEVRGHQLPWEMIPYDVQLVGGIALHEGNIAEMATGEGKTLVATLPVYLNALSGRGVHVVTVNDYLAQRDSEWMGAIYKYLGLSVGCIVHDMNPAQRREQYNCDITYGTNSEFGFDYLRDNGMASRSEDQVQRGYYFAIVDEVDSILIDEARTPLIISGPAAASLDKEYRKANPKIKSLVQAQHKLVAGYLIEAEKLSKQLQSETPTENADELGQELGLLLYKARLGQPKSERLLRLMEEPQNQKLIDKAELALHADQSKKELYAQKEELYFGMEEKSHDADLTEKGRSFLNPNDTEAFMLPDLSVEQHDIDNDESLDAQGRLAAKTKLQDEFKSKAETIHITGQLLKAYSLYVKDVAYVVQENKVIIVDEHTGRAMPGRRWSDGLHQAVEAKEGVTIEQETQTLATITIQNYFRLYTKLAGMTGTAATEAQEFFDIYKLGVLTIPTHEPCIREDANDSIFKSRREKYNAVLDEIKETHRQGRPILVGTVSVEVSELISRMLKKNGIIHSVLNAKYHEQEAEIVARAGQKGSVTIATNMAGRGTDIKLGQGVESIGGLHVVATERHESRRIDRQLRGRCARQGDKGSTHFFLSLEDDLLRLFASGNKLFSYVEKGMEEGQPLESRMLNPAIQKAQQNVEKHHFQIRKRTLEYDDVMNKQRAEIYGFRNDVMHTDRVQEKLIDIMDEVIANKVQEFCDPELEPVNWDFQALSDWANLTFPVGVSADSLAGLVETKAAASTDDDRDMTPHQQLLFDDISAKAKEAYQLKISFEESEALASVERFTILNSIDRLWQEHLYEMDSLRYSIGLRAYAQRDPILEYKAEGYHMFQELQVNIWTEICQNIFRSASSVDAFQSFLRNLPVQEVHQSTSAFGAEERRAANEASDMVDEATDMVSRAEPVRTAVKVGRNDPCPCGSGKKHKKCCG
ncbi:MAG: preprotein translocase subunit SecA [Verrucomicrobiota bacterium]|nr:preprotein translocase subunit SecA [Verrucomicrobiota bacterium]MDP7047999.1 preprotein translocase subunit SecA [Verrucomicrobiota bacterium]